jgi:Tfp pilus assembly protein PilV
MIETLMAAAILVIGSIGMLGMIVSAIATNNRNRIDSTQTMLAQTILEQIATTFVTATQTTGPGTSSIVDCAGNTWTIDTTITSSGSTGAPLSGSSIDFSQAQVQYWSMNYVVSTPCSSTGTVQGTYDVRWHLDRIGSTLASPPETYLITVSARLLGHGEGNLYFSLPVTLRFMTGG